MSHARKFHQLLVHASRLGETSKHFEIDPALFRLLEEEDALTYSMTGRVLIADVPLYQVNPPRPGFVALVVESDPSRKPK